MWTVVGVILWILTLWPTEPKMPPKRYTTQSCTCEAADEADSSFLFFFDLSNTTWVGAYIRYLLGLLAKIKCSICSYQLNLWYSRQCLIEINIISRWGLPKILPTEVDMDNSGTNLKVKVGITLTKDVSLRINLNMDGTPITLRTHTHPSHSQTSRLLTSSLSLGVPVPRATQCMRGV